MATLRKIEAYPRHYIQKHFTIDEWCTYKGECKVYDLVCQDIQNACLLCKHRKPLDIPAILDRIEKEGE